VNDRHGSRVENAQTRPSVTPSSSAIRRARDSLEVPVAWVWAAFR